MNILDTVFLLLILLMLFVSPVFAYIDPATGSMLFSIIIGIVTIIFFLLKSIWYKVFFIITGYNRKIKTNYIPIVLYNEGKKYVVCFEPLLNEFENKKVTVVYYTSEEDDPILNKNYKYIKTEFIGKGNKAYMKLSILQADVCVMTTPGLDVYQLRKSKQVKHYCHIFHGIGDHCDYRLFGLDYYDSLMIINEINASYIKKIEKKRNLKPKELVVAGSLDLDRMYELLKSYNKKQSSTFTVLVAPTWGPQAILSKYGTDLIDELIKTDWNIIIRPHPQSFISEKELIEKIKNKYTNNKNIIWDSQTNNLDSLSKSDILISDFSGIIFDYAFLFNRSFIYTEYEQNREIYDYSDLSCDTWKTEFLNKIGFELKKDNFKNIVNIINNIIKDKEKINNISKVKNIVWQKQGQSAKIVADFIIKKQKDLAQ